MHMHYTSAAEEMSRVAVRYLAEISVSEDTEDRKFRHSYDILVRLGSSVLVFKRTILTFRSLLDFTANANSNERWALQTRAWTPDF
jgi:hypothetical protein